MLGTPGWFYPPEGFSLFTRSYPKPIEVIHIPMYETWGAMEHLVSIGLTRLIGVANCSAFIRYVRLLCYSSIFKSS
jgi:aryl-alcohol dehydrogenase-like predicted oxidoreductase